MSEDLAALPPETFFRLAVERGGLDLEEVVQGLSPEVAEALRLIAAPTLPESSTRGMTRSAPDRLLEPDHGPLQLECRACGRVNQPGDRFCRSCGRQLDESPPSNTLGDLVAKGWLTPKQADEAQARLSSFQSHYTAGTRYSVFGSLCVQGSGGQSADGS